MCRSGFRKMAEALLVMLDEGRGEERRGGESQMVRVGHYVGRRNALCHTLCVVYGNSARGGIWDCSSVSNPLFGNAVLQRELPPPPIRSACRPEHTHTE